MASIPAAAPAHEPVRIEPEAGSVLSRPVRRISATFKERLTDESRIEVNDGCGQSLVTDSRIDGNTLHAQLKPGEPGNWFVYYRVVAAHDGHETSGSYTFTIRGRAGCEGITQVSPTLMGSSEREASGTLGMIALEASIVILVSLVGLVFYRHRRTSESSVDDPDRA